MLEVSKITRGHTCVGSSVFYEFGSIKFVYSLAGWTTRIRTGLDGMWEKAMTAAGLPRLASVIEHCTNTQSFVLFYLISTWFRVKSSVKIPHGGMYAIAVTVFPIIYIGLRS